MLHVPGWRDERNREERLIMEQDIIILSCSAPWAIKDKQTGAVEREGVTVWYIMTDELKPIIKAKGDMGYTPCKTSLDKSFYEKLKSLGVPGVAHAVMDMAEEKGQPVLKVVGLDI